MTFVKSDIIKMKVLQALAEENKEHTYYSLTKKTGVSFSSLAPNCKFLETVGFIYIKHKQSVKGTYNFITITTTGKQALKHLQKRA